jgi:hypothetical protein
MELIHAFLRHAGNYFVLRDIISLQNEISVSASYVFMLNLNRSTYSNCIMRIYAMFYSFGLVIYYTIVIVIFETGSYSKKY